MRRFIALWIGAFLCAGLLVQGCSFSVSNVHVVKGADKIAVTADQPAEPEPEPEPEPAPKPKPKKKKKAKMVGKKIEITEKVMFEYNKATIDPVSNELLTDVADVIKENPKVKLIRVEGHTDSDGKDDYNMELSQNRADAVVAFLVDAGVPEEKLEAVGFGEENPIADNETDEGKEKNRRVEFNVVKQRMKKKGKKGKKNKKDKK